MIDGERFSSSMKILWGSEQPTRPTGYGVVTREIAKRLVERGHEVYCIGWDYNGETIKHEEGWHLLHAGISGYGGEKILPRPDSPSVLDAHLHELDPDVYVSLIDPWFIGHAVLSTNNAGVPYIPYIPIDGYPFSYDWKDIIKMAHTPMWMSKFGKQTFDDFVSEFSSEGDHIDMMDPILDRYHSHPTPILYHGVDLKVFRPIGKKEKQKLRKKLGLDKFDFVMLSVAKNTNRKQQPRMLEAFKQFLDETGAKAALVIHCGDPTDSFGMGGWNLPNMVNQMGLSENVIFSDNSNNPLLGLSREQLAELYQASDAHVMATGGEGFGIPSAEALACGIPIILPDNSTGPELIGEDERGWLAKSATHIVGPRWGVNMTLVDVDDLARCMKECYEDEDSRHSRGSAGREFAKEWFDWEKIVDELEYILKRVRIQPHPLGQMSKQVR